jgi:hypothetical protein
LYGGAERTNRYSDLPQFIGQESRRRVQDPPVTRYDLGLKSDDDDKGFVFDIGGGLTDVRGVGTEKDLYGSLKWLDLPFNIPGNVSVEGGGRKPIGGERSAYGGFRYTLNPWRGSK